MLRKCGKIVQKFESFRKFFTSRRHYFHPYAWYIEENCCTSTYSLAIYQYPPQINILSWKLNLPIYQHSIYLTCRKPLVRLEEKQAFLIQAEQNIFKLIQSCTRLSFSFSTIVFLSLSSQKNWQTAFFLLCVLLYVLQWPSSFSLLKAEYPRI